MILLAADEARFGRISDTRRCWAPHPIRPIAPRQVIQEYSYVYAAVSPVLGRMTTLILPYVNTEMMNRFIGQVAIDFSQYFVILLVDQAGWHLSGGLSFPDNVRFIYQPAYSPELNPAEHLWEELREKELANKAFDSLDTLEDALCEGLNQLASHPQRLRSLTDFPYFKVTPI